MTKIRHSLFVIIVCIGFYNKTMAQSTNSVSQTESVTGNFTVISSNDKTYFLLLNKQNVINQSNFIDVKNVNAYFQNIPGIIECSYSWNSNDYKLTLEKNAAKDILQNVFLFDLNYINSKLK